MRIAVLGAGGWGTTLARLLCLARHEVTLWGHDPLHLEEMAATSLNARYLPGIPLPTTWRLESDVDRAVANAECALVAVPSKAFREVT